MGSARYRMDISVEVARFYETIETNINSELGEPMNVS